VAAKDHLEDGLTHSLRIDSSERCETAHRSVQFPLRATISFRTSLSMPTGYGEYSEPLIISSVCLLIRGKTTEQGSHMLAPDEACYTTAIR
jgi:hypothetical protein